MTCDVEATTITNGPTLEITGSELMILRRTDAGWKFARYIFSIASNTPRE